MSEQDKSPSSLLINKISELTDIDAKDKDKMNSNEIKILFNLAANNGLNSILKDTTRQSINVFIGKGIPWNL